MADEQIVLLSVLADRPYWMSILEILGPPTGASFHRAFDYRSEWVDETLLGNLKDGSGHLPLRAIVGMRFKDDESGAAGRFIPIREAQATLRRNGSVSASLLLKGYVQLDAGDKDLQDLVIPAASRNNKDGEPLLARIASGGEQQKVGAWHTKSLPDHNIWDALATSPKLPQAVQDRFKDRVVLYCPGITLQKTGRKLQAEQIASGERGLTTIGYKFTVGETYDVDLQMRRIGSPGQAAFPEAPDFEFITDKDRVTPAASVIPFSGNYRGVRTWVRPTVKQTAPLDLWWHPREQATQSGENRLANVALRIPVVVKRRLPWVMGLLALLLVAAGATLYSFAATLSEDTQRTQASALIAAGTVVVSLGTALVLRVVDQFTSQE